MTLHVRKDYIFNIQVDESEINNWITEARFNDKDLNFLMENGNINEDNLKCEFFEDIAHNIDTTSDDYDIINTNWWVD